MLSSSRAVVAQLVERHLAKVEVASPSLVYRSTGGLSGPLFFVPASSCPLEGPGKRKNFMLFIGASLVYNIKVKLYAWSVKWLKK